jgi:hypothetical protein
MSGKKTMPIYSQLRIIYRNIKIDDYATTNNDCGNLASIDKK